MAQQGVDWVGVYAAALSTVIVAVQSVRYLMGRRTRLKVECHQLSGPFNDFGDTPHLKVTAFNRSQGPVLVLQWTLEDTSPRAMAFQSWLANRLRRIPQLANLVPVRGITRYRAKTIRLRESSAPELPQDGVPQVLGSDKNHASWSMDLTGFRREWADVMGGNADRLRARVYLDGGRSFCSKRFALKDHAADPNTVVLVTGRPPVWSAGSTLNGPDTGPDQTAT